MSDDEDTHDQIKRLLDSEDNTRADVPSQPARSKDEYLSHPALDKDNMPLPRRVDEIDVGGTRVTRAAYEEPITSPRRTASTPHHQQQDGDKYHNKRRPSGFQNLRNQWGCLMYALVVGLFAIVILLLTVGSFLIYKYYSIASTLPEIGDLKARASQFETTRIMDRNGNLLYEILDPNAGRRTYIPLERISPNLVAATIATEDKDFYKHAGFDPVAIVRALWQNYTSGDTVSGASTITQQLARALLLSPDERAQKTYSRKAREIILAAEITRRYSKDEILELYLNEIYYGNLAYGAEAASETYFGKSADQLALGEAAFLAGLPQSPAIYDIYTNPQETLIRQQQVLVLMFELSNQQECIKVSNSDTPVCVDPLAATNAATEMKSYAFRPPSLNNARYPHWVNFIRTELEKQYDAQTIYRSGFTVYTTLDPTLQDQAQQIVTQQVATLVDKDAHNGALVAIKPSTGEILAMVGSADFNNVDIAGQINMATSQTRQPGSSIKPINYVAAFEKGWTPSTLIWDVPSEFPPSGDPNDTREPYKPSNYDGKFHGPVTVRVALANSFNVPAVKTLYFVGVYDNPATPEKDGMIGMAERLGITSFTAPDYGLSLTLGGGEVSLLEMTSAFSVFAKEGKRIPPVAILKITDFAGTVIHEYKAEPPQQVIRPEHAYLISSILSDNNARSWMFGANSVLNLPFQAAAKTGTSGTPRGDAEQLIFDNWTLGYTPDLVSGVWIGNADYKPMVNTTGSTGAAPIWSQFMQYAVPYVTNNNPTWFKRPDGIVDRVVCSISGTEPSNWCKQQYTEIFASDQLPLPPGQDLVRNIKLDVWTGLEASDACREFTEEETVLNITDKFARDWLATGDGRNWLEKYDLPNKPIFAPERECNTNDPHPIIEFMMKEGQVITQPTIEIKGSAYADDGIKRWTLEYGKGADPSDWTTLNDGKNPIQSGTLSVWNLAGLQNGAVTLRLTLTGERGEVQRFLHLTLDLPLPTEPATLTPTLTPIPPTETVTFTPVPPTDTPPVPPSDTPTVFP